MYPKKYFELFSPFPRENKVFVAMSFNERFQARWEQVIAPAIRSVTVNDTPLEPHRVDTRQISDSILTEIEGGISNDLMVFADITSEGQLNDKPVRNGNVMYEVGLAHAVRQPEEVLLFRSDSERILFDIANVRVNSYQPDENQDDARNKVTNAIVEALKEINLKRHLAVKAASATLDFRSWWILSLAHVNNGIRHFQTRTMRQVLANTANNASIIRLLEMGALSTDYPKITPELIKSDADVPAEHLMTYEPTPFGTAILEYAADKMGVMSPEMRTYFEEFIASETEPND